MNNRPLFSLGRILITPGASIAISEANRTPTMYFTRHQSGDWGEVSAEEANDNNDSVRLGEGAMSAYTLPTGATIWIITESDHSVTTCLLPEEY
jgi:hypothetical protein